MKGYFSVTALWLRRSLLPLIALLAALFAAQTGAFFLALRGQGQAGLEAVFAAAHPGLIAAAAFLLLCAWLFYIGGEFSGRQSYTLRRLSVTRLGGFLARWAACSLCFLILWGAQAATVLWLCGLYRRFGAPELWSGQAVLLALYRSAFLHALLPLHDAAVWVRNAFLLLSLGAAAARLPNGKKPGFFPCWAILAVCWFRHELGSVFSDIFFIGAGAVVIAVELYRAAAREEGSDYAAQTL